MNDGFILLLLVLSPWGMPVVAFLGFFVWCALVARWRKDYRVKVSDGRARAYDRVNRERGES